MAHARQDVALAEKAGVSPATIERDRPAGMWPADPMADIKRHYEVMTACGKVPGRSKDRTWAIALDAAERFRWPVKLLRTVLADPPPIDGARLAERIRPLVLSLAAAIVLPVPEAHGPSAEVAEAVADDTYRAVEKVVRGEQSEPDDFEDVAEIVATTVDRAVEAGAPDDGGEDTDRPFAVDVYGEVVALVERMSSWRPWAKEATAGELAGAVVLGGRLVDLLNAIAPASATDGDQRRAEVAFLAPWCGAELIPAGFEKVLPTIAELAHPHLDEASIGEAG